MKVRVGDLRQRAAQAQKQDPMTALKLWWRLVDVSPGDPEPRVRIADLLDTLGAKEPATNVYQATARLALAGGHPLVAMVLGHVLEARGMDPTPLYQELAAKYAKGSPFLQGRGQRIAPAHPDDLIEPPDLERPMPDRAVLAGAAAAAADLSRVDRFPEALHKVPLLSELAPDAFVELCRATRAIRLPPKALVIREGEMGRSFYWLALGGVSVFKTDLRGVRTILARLGPGALFGEMALIQASPRTASVETEGDTDLLEMEAGALQILADQLEAVAKAMDHFARERLLANLMATSPIFQPFTRQQRLDLLRRFVGYQVSPGTEIIREGDEGRGLYVVLSGEVEVTKEQDGRQVPLATLRSGDVFGEISLVKGYPATATVRAVKPSTVLFLDRVYFQRLVSALPEIAELFARMSEERLTETRLLLADDLVIEESDDLVLV